MVICFFKVQIILKKILSFCSSVLKNYAYCTSKMSQTYKTQCPVNGKIYFGVTVVVHLVKEGLLINEMFMTC